MSYDGNYVYNDFRLLRGRIPRQIRRPGYQATPSQLPLNAHIVNGVLVLGPILIPGVPGVPDAPPPPVPYSFVARTHPMPGVWNGTSVKRPTGVVGDSIREEGVTPFKRTMTLTACPLGKRAATTNLEVLFDEASDEPVSVSNGLLPVKVPVEIPVRLAWALPIENLDVVSRNGVTEVVSPPSDAFPSPMNEEQYPVSWGDDDPPSPETGEPVTSDGLFSTRGKVASSSSDYMY